MSRRPCSVVTCGHAEPPRQREVQVVEVPVDDVEAVGLGRHLLELNDVVRERIDDAGVQPQGAAERTATSSRRVVESPLANSVTSWPWRTSSSVR